MTQYLSDKLRVLSLISIILVLYIHSGFHADEIEGMVMNDRVQEFVSGMMGRCAVPLFYVISGYLFFLKVPEGMKSIYGKMRKRGGDVGCALYHRMYVLCWLWRSYGRVARCVKIYEQFGNASFFKAGRRNSSFYIL